MSGDTFSSHLDSLEQSLALDRENADRSKHRRTKRDGQPGDVRPKGKLKRASVADPIVQDAEMQRKRTPPLIAEQLADARSSQLTFVTDEPLRRSDGLKVEHAPRSSSPDLMGDGEGRGLTATAMFAHGTVDQPPHNTAPEPRVDLRAPKSAERSIDLNSGSEIDPGTVEPVSSGHIKGASPSREPGRSTDLAQAALAVASLAPPNVAKKRVLPESFLPGGGGAKRARGGKSAQPKRKLVPEKSETTTTVTPSKWAIDLLRRINVI
ncbi:hypothetical protein M427DRAFT_359950 [Gonapodya prolifera JEL478]|uniref:Uncharacterized protein n=1 Tax=Gonapodya prolifera (strain JEL478) TaxID=1344416 RepID=A0A139AAU2_GONPJ|nr:hypothetical protein M427DRAFT_359950 [Gonapodya prolifera JEL478]|eukprot:KXS13926.1 hypothetical protein M427DRAFT_359950 [Gonapodya prolifera JEL478]